MFKQGQVQVEIDPKVLERAVIYAREYDRVHLAGANLGGTFAEGDIEKLQAALVNGRFIDGGECMV